MTRNSCKLLDVPGTLGGNDLPHAERRLADADAGSEPHHETALGADEVHADHDKADISVVPDKDQAENIASPELEDGDSDFMDGGMRIKQARQRVGLRQVDLARRLRVEQSAISQWESGKFAPDLENRMALAAELRIALRDLMPEPQAVSVEALNDPQTRRIVDYFWQLDPHTRSVVEMLLMRMIERSGPDHSTSPPSPSSRPPARARRR